MMRVLQRMVEDYVAEWRPGNERIFRLDLNHTMRDVFMVEACNPYISGIDSVYDGELHVWYKLKTELLLDRYERRKNQKGE